MDEVSRDLLHKLRSRPQEDLDDDELETLLYLEDVEDDDRGRAASVHELSRVGRSERGSAQIPHCPECLGRDFKGRTTARGIINTCKNPECGHRWKGGGILPFFAPGSGPRVPKQGPYIDTSGGAPPGNPKLYFRDPRKAKIPDD